MSIGDINSTAKGSGARFNDGKVPLELVPLRLIAASYEGHFQRGTAEFNAVLALDALGQWQETGDRGYLYDVIALLGRLDGWAECARVFEYGKGKYAAWNWTKGMPWTVPMACAARHLLAIIQGTPDDAESKLPHRGHVICNVVMLLTYESLYPEGDDRPRAWQHEGSEV